MPRHTPRPTPSPTSSSTARCGRRPSPPLETPSPPPTTRSGRATFTSTRQSLQHPPGYLGSGASRRGPRVLLRRVRPVPAELTGIEDLRADWAMDGGGLHQTLRGGHLNVHTDFSTHHQHPTWARRSHPALPQRAVGARMGRPARTLGHEGDRARGCRHAARQPHAHLHHERHQLPRPPRPVDLSGRDGSPFARPLLLHRGGENGPSGHELPPRPGDGALGIAIWADGVVLDLYDRVKVRTGISDRAVYRVLDRVNRLRRPGRRARR